MEVVISRMRYLSSQKKERDENSSLRIVGLGASLANAREVAEWMGVPSKSIFNFSPKVRPTPLEIYFQSFDQNNFSSRLMAMAKPVYNAVMRPSDGKPTIVFVPSRRQAQLTAIDLMAYRESLDEGTFLGTDADSSQVSAAAEELKEATLQQVVTAGIGFVHEGLSELDWESVTSMLEFQLICDDDAHHPILNRMTT